MDHHHTLKAENTEALAYCQHGYTYSTRLTCTFVEVKLIVLPICFLKYLFIPHTVLFLLKEKLGEIPS